MNKLQQLMYNDGERLVPYVTHGEGELVRHRSSYAFFHSVIASDLDSHLLADDHVRVADLGFGGGYGSALLSSLPGSQITGVDIAPECELFARQYYPRSNVNYVLEDLATYIPGADSFEYVVSRGVLEHVPDGLNLIKDIKFGCRAMIDVPYDEEPGNEHHVLTGIKEDAFADFVNCELFYEDIEGRIFDIANKPEESNMIMVVLSSPELPKVSSLFEFPLEPVRDTELETLSGMKAMGEQFYSNSPVELLASAEKAIKETEVVADIGCGIAPMNYFRPKFHFMIEPWSEYADILSYRYSGDKSVVILRTGALEALKTFSDNSVDSIFLLDVVEHMEKEEGLQVISESERIAREQIVVFTPLGFMPQHVEGSGVDGWGLNGHEVQEHRSGWTPEDFSDAWTHYICEEFHGQDFKGEKLDETYGAFFAIRNFERKTVQVPEPITDFRRPLPSEVELQKIQVKFDTDVGLLKVEAQALRDEYHALLNSRSMRLIGFMKRILKAIGIRRTG